MADDTFSPAHNFTLGTDDRVRALAAGPPAHLRRLRAIEDLEQAIVRAMVERGEKAACAGLGPAEQAACVAAPPPASALGKLNDLVARHNRCYPIEANLPVSIPSGELLDRTGRPWRPLPARSAHELVERARALWAQTRQTRDVRPGRGA